MKRYVSLFAVIMLMLTACSGTRISSEIYLVDIEEIPEEDDMTVKVMIGLSISSVDECAEGRQRYQSVFRKSSGFKNMEFVRCYEEGYSDLAEFELEIPVRMADPSASSMQGTFEVIRADDSDTGHRNLYIRSKPSALCNLDGLIRDEFYRSLDFSEVSPRVVITNDLRESQNLILNQVFANGAPLIHATEIVMERRDSLHVVLSDVTTAWLFSKACNTSPRTALVAVWLANA